MDNFVNIINNLDVAEKVLANGEDMAKEYTRLTNKNVDSVINQYQDISRVALL